MPKGFSVVLCGIIAVLWAAGPSLADQPGLKEVFHDDFLMGAALNRRQILGNAEGDMELALRHFNTVTPENCLKWSSVQPRPGRWNFRSGDRLAELADEHDLHVVGHTLIWHNQTPGWVFEDEQGQTVDRDTLIERMKEHIHTVVGRYKGRFAAWDVVNEAIEDDGTLRKTPWLEIIGPDYIAKAFEFAAQADPQARLYYNDYNMHLPGRRRAVVRLVESLAERGIVVHGVGMQGHWQLDWPLVADIDKSIAEFGRLGVEVMITELDISVLPAAWQHRGADIRARHELSEQLNPWPDGLCRDMEQKLARRYAQLFELFGQHREVISRVTFWGVHDGNSWLNNWPVAGRTDYPLLFDRQGKPKQAFQAVIEAAKSKR